MDIDPETCNIDPDKIEAAITPKTTAIMPVHVYGKPCDTERIQAIADKYGLKVIYDAAHAFGVEVNGKSVLNAGDMSTLRHWQIGMEYMPTTAWYGDTDKAFGKTVNTHSVTNHRILGLVMYYF